MDRGALFVPGRFRRLVCEFFERSDSASFVILSERCASRRTSRGPPRVKPRGQTKLLRMHPSAVAKTRGLSACHPERACESRDTGSLCSETLAMLAQKDRGPSTRAALAQDDTIRKHPSTKRCFFQDDGSRGLRAEDRARSFDSGSLRSGRQASGCDLLMGPYTLNLRVSRWRISPGC